MGDLAAGHEWLQRACTAYDPARDAALKYTLGTDPLAEVLVWDAISTWHRNYPDQARAMANRAVAWARELDHSYTLCHVLCAGSSVHQECGDYSASLPWTEEGGELAAREHFPFWVHTAAVHRGIAIGHLGDPAHGIELIERGLDAWQAVGVTAFHSWYTCDLAMLDRLRGAGERGLERCERAIAEARSTGTGMAEVRAVVTRAVLTTNGDPRAAIEALEEAVAVAHVRDARWLEMQAATELAVLLRATGRRSAGHDVLAPVVARFTEGSATPHLTEARRLLSELAEA